VPSSTFSWRPVLDVYEESPATELTTDAGLTEEAYLLEPATGLVYRVGPAFLTGDDIASAEAIFVPGPDGQPELAGWVVVPRFTADGA
jgi:hypothetical protein